MKKTLVFGASLKSNRYSKIALQRLLENNIETEGFGIHPGVIYGVQIRTDLRDIQDIHTVTLYINPQKQVAYYETIIRLMPQRVIFNPGTENPDFYELLDRNNIRVEVACTLVLLATGQY